MCHLSAILTPNVSSVCHTSRSQLCVPSLSLQTCHLSAIVAPNASSVCLTSRSQLCVPVPRVNRSIKHLQAWTMELTCVLQVTIGANIKLYLYSVVWRTNQAQKTYIQIECKINWLFYLLICSNSAILQTRLDKRASTNKNKNRHTSLKPTKRRLSSESTCPTHPLHQTTAKHKDYTRLTPAV